MLVTLMRSPLSNLMSLKFFSVNKLRMDRSSRLGGTNTAKLFLEHILHRACKFRKQSITL